MTDGDNRRRRKISIIVQQKVIKSVWDGFIGKQESHLKAIKTCAILPGFPFSLVSFFFKKNCISCVVHNDDPIFRIPIRMVLDNDDKNRSTESFKSGNDCR